MSYAWLARNDGPRSDRPFGLWADYADSDGGDGNGADGNGDNGGGPGTGPPGAAGTAWLWLLAAAVFIVGTRGRDRG